MNSLSYIISYIAVSTKVFSQHLSIHVYPTKLIDSDTCSLSLLDLGSWCFSKKEREAWVHLYVLFSSITLKHLAASIKTP